MCARADDARVRSRFGYESDGETVSVSGGGWSRGDGTCDPGRDVPESVREE